MVLPSKRWFLVASVRLYANSGVEGVGTPVYQAVIDTATHSHYAPGTLSDIETTDLDVAAMEHGYQRPPLKDFGARHG